MKKLFISQPMNGLTDEQILEERKRILKEVKCCYIDEEVELIDSFIENVPQDAKPLWYLGESLKFLSQADIAFFAYGWTKARGCRIEHISAIEYGIQTIEEGSRALTE